MIWYWSSNSPKRARPFWCSLMTSSISPLSCVKDETLETIAARARAQGQAVAEGSVFPALAGSRPAIHFRDPNGHLVEVLAS